VPLNLILSPLYRIHGQEAASFPGLAAVAPPRKTARGREQDFLAVQLLLTGNASFSVADYAALAQMAGERFHQSSGPLTSALRAAADAINESLLQRNLATSGRGQYAIGWLALAALRDTQCTFLISGPMHVFVMGEQSRHIFEPALSGRGLGVSKSSTRYFTQAELKPGDRVLMTGKLPSAWETTLADAVPASLEVTRRRLLGLTGEDLHAVLMQATAGTGSISILQTAGESASVTSVPSRLPVVDQVIHQPVVAPQVEAENISSLEGQPSAYAIPAQPVVPQPPSPVVEPQSVSRIFPPSIPRLKPVDEKPSQESEDPGKSASAAGREPSRVTRQAAKAAVGGIRVWRQGNQRFKEGLRGFLPRLFPGNEAGESRPLPAYAMTFIAMAVPILVVTAAMVVYLRFGRSAQYENYMAQAQTARVQAASLSDPVMQRDAWQSVLLYVDKAESYRKTSDADALRTEAEGRLDSLLGVLRLEFQPAFTNSLGIEISRMAATENDLYLLDARTGEIIHAQSTGRGFQKDVTFECKPGSYGGYQVGPLVDILALPLLNSVKATVVGVDAGGNLLYCAPGQVAQAIPLPPPDTNWGRVTAMTMDAGNLYVLDAPSRAVWVYVGKDGAFVDRPYFFFTEQIPAIQDGIDLVVKDDTLFLLHSDGHLSTCSYSRIETVPTRCQDPATLINPYAAYKDTDLFAQAHITQMMYTSPPDSTILLLGADGQGVMRLTPGSLELQNQIRPAAGKNNPLPAGPIDAMTASPNHVLYLAVKDQVYFATNMP
jgi:hypothetical protein